MSRRHPSARSAARNVATETWSMTYGAIPGLSQKVSRIVLGTGSFGGKRQVDIRRLLDEFVAAGGNAIDTAAVYADGASERAVGEWLERTGRRKDVIIMTKGGHPALPGWEERLTPEDVEDDLTGSLARLGVTAVDLYMLHRDSQILPVDELVSMLAPHVRNGRVKTVGVSNWRWQRIEEANQYASQNGLPPIVASSVHYALAAPTRSIAPGTVTASGDPGEREWYARTRLPLLAWSAQSGGFFSTAPPPFAPGSAPVYDSSANRLRRQRAIQLARRYGRPASQIALAWLLSQPLDVYAVVGPTRLAHLRDCLHAADLRLSQPEADWLDLKGGQPDGEMPDRDQPPAVSDLTEAAHGS